VPGACPWRQRRQWAWLQRQQASSNFCHTASLLKRPSASAVNATSKHSVSQREHRKRYVTFALRNARPVVLSITVVSCSSRIQDDLTVWYQLTHFSWKVAIKISVVGRLVFLNLHSLVHRIANDYVKFQIFGSCPNSKCKT